jgi:hypothetical protein
MALLGKTAKQWREENPGSKGNIRGAHQWGMRISFSDAPT